MTVALLSVLGLAIGFTTITPGDITSTLGSGTGVWSAISILIALVVGGWAAARTAAVPGRANGALNGALSGQSQKSCQIGDAHDAVGAGERLHIPLKTEGRNAQG